jgi:competence/damage-inducible protein CinA-like protein
MDDTAGPRSRTLTAAILSQGDEVVTGQVTNGNAAWLAERATDLGFEVRRHVAVGDRLEDLIAQLNESAGRADLVLSSGGLGPTQDDLTAEAVAEAFGLPLERDEQALARIKDYFARAGRQMADVNRKQADLPRGAERLDNDRGTAPGFVVEQAGTYLAFLPGVPVEMKRMFDEQLAPRLERRFRLEPRQLVTIRVVGLGESTIQQRLGRIEDERFVLSYRTRLPENHVKLRFAPGVPGQEIERIVSDLRERIGASAFAVEGLEGQGGELADVVGQQLRQRGDSLSVAESVSGGQLALLCASAEGASAWFREAVVVPNASAKARLLGPNGVVLDELGDETERTIALARAIRTACGTTWGLATGDVSDAGDAEGGGKAVVALSGPEDNETRTLNLAHRPDRRGMLAAAAALDLLRRKLKGT